MDSTANFPLPLLPTIDDDLDAMEYMRDDLPMALFANEINAVRGWLSDTLIHS
jgi:hypothetical protein